MGNLCGPGMTPQERTALKAEKEASNALDGTLRMQNSTEAKVHKLLLLGTGESGKSTVFKQMQILYDTNKDFSAIEKSTFKHVLRTNIVETMQALINGVEKFEIEYTETKSAEAVRNIMDLDAHGSDFWDTEIIPDIQHLWYNEPAIQTMFSKRAKIQLLDSAPYLFEHVERIGAEDFLPTKDDILRARLRTSGIHEKVFDIHGVEFKFLDVGGQRNERRKWIHCFQDVTSVIFIAAISEYDQVLYEKDDKNRLHESIEQFAELSNLEDFRDTAFILFLNKIDLFEDKIPQVSMKDACFPDFEGNVDSIDECLEYITQQFLAARELPSPGIHIYPHATCATDTDNIEKVFDACKLIILQSNLEKLGIS